MWCGFARSDPAISVTRRTMTHRTMTRSTMKNFTFLVASTVAATVALVSTDANANSFGAISNVVRYQTQSGLTNNYAGVSTQGLAPLAGSISNVSGTAWASTWNEGSRTNSALSLGNPNVSQPLSESEVDSFLNTHSRGLWTANTGTSTFQFDTTSVLKSAAQRNYLTLTASSVALWENVVATNAVGTFTFELTQSLGSLGFAWGNTAADGSNVSFHYFDLVSTSFSLTVSAATDPSQRATRLFLAGSTAESTLYSANGNEATYMEGSITTVGGAVPAPGAIALLGLAGLAGRRRR